MDVGKTGIQSDLPAAEGVGFGGGGQIVEVEPGMKGQQAVRNFGI